MRGQKFPAFVVVVSAVVVAACGNDAKKETPQESPKVVASAPPPVPVEPPTPSKDVAFEATDKVPLSGKLYLSKDPAAPLLVFVHRFRGDRSEWDAAAERLSKSEKRYNILNFDLRGHGASKSATGKTVVDWADMDDKDMPTLVRDVRGAIDFGIAQTDGKARGVVLVGSSLGAALVAQAASEDARVMAVGVISPGAAINGFDVYHPFARVRQLPAFIAAAKDDNVSKDPVPALSRMAGATGTLKMYDGGGHGAHGLLHEQAPLLDDLESWLLSVFDRAPVAREVVKAEEAGVKRKKTGR